MYNKKQQINIFEEKKLSSLILISICLLLILPTLTIAKNNHSKKVPIHKYYKKHPEFNGGIFIPSKKLQKISKKMHAQFHDVASPIKKRYAYNTTRPHLNNKTAQDKLSFAEVTESVFNDHR
jgi:hypothetical protein